MNIRNIIRMTIVLFSLLMLSIGSVFAQEVDLDSMSDEELMVLLTKIADRLGVEIIVLDPSAEGTPEPYAEAVSEATAEPETFKSWMNKKLVVGVLPAYLFIQPTQEIQDDSTPGKPGEKKDDEGSCPVGEQCDHYQPWCTWVFMNGTCRCSCGDG